MGTETQEITKMTDSRPLLPYSHSVFTHTLGEQLGVTVDDFELYQDGGSKVR